MFRFTPKRAWKSLRICSETHSSKWGLNEDRISKQGIIPVTGKWLH